MKPGASTQFNAVGSDTITHFYNIKNNTMNSFKHLIITRFMCDNFLKKDVTNVNPLSNKWKEMAFDVAKRHIIPTLENQNNQNFTLVFLVGSNCNDEDIQRIYNLSDKLDIDICYLQYFKEYIENIETDYLITSRLDYDDHVFKYCVNFNFNYRKNSFFLFY